jgi:DNA-binding transcriptional LysR family regulator
MPNLNELAIFGAVAARCSFTEGARALRLPKATVSRRVRALEARLGIRLLQRTTRRVTVTEAGEALLKRWRLIEEHLEEADVAIGRLRGAPRGLLRVAAGSTLMAEWIAPLAALFLSRHAAVRMELLSVSDPVGQVGRGVDLAIAHAHPTDSTRVTRLLARVPTGLYASRDYLGQHQAPATPQDLADHPALLLTLSPGTPREWRLRRGRRQVAVPIVPRLIGNDMGPLLAALRAGAGVLAAPRVTVADLVASGRLVRVLPEWTPPPLEVRVVFPSRSGLPPRTRLFIDLLVEQGATVFPTEAAGIAPGTSPAAPGGQGPSQA